MNPRALLVALALGLAGTASAAAPLPTGFHFTHKDWEVACDNTGTCRAAGYHEEYSESRVSVLVTRRPGPGTRPEVQVQVGSHEVIPGLKPLPPRPVVVTMYVNDRPLGPVRLDNAQPSALSRAQAAALLAALPRAGARITWNHSHYEWVLSDQGARAVLLKMDEAQGRLNTPGALVARGTRDERQVPGLRSAPVIRVPPVPPTLVADRAWPERQGPALLAALRATVAKGDMCSLLMEDRDREWEVRRLNARQLLVSAPCWSAAYNFGAGAWVVNEHPPYAPVLVTDSASGINDTEVVASHKDRGLGDCWDHQAWAWDGTRFERSERRSTGMCRSIQPGGTWNLPTLVTRVQPR